jgi:hypothetical protein
MSGSNNIKKNKKRMTKKGLIITILILVGIIGTSFLVYLVPG